MNPGAVTGEHGGSIHGAMGLAGDAVQIGMFNAAQDFDIRSPATEVPGMTYKHIMAMNAPSS